MEKWTAADEKLWAELEARRAALHEKWRNDLECALSKVNLWDGVTGAVDNVIEHAAEISAALEPFVLSARGNDNG